MPTHPDKEREMISPISRLVSRVQRRLDGEEGFTLVELTIVMLIFGILLTIALPSYLSLQDRANKTAAKQDVAQAVKAIIAYGNDNYSQSPADPDLPNSTDNGYQNITLSALATKYDASISTTAGAPFVLNPAGYSGSSATDFCITASVGRWIAVQHGNSGGINVGTLFTPGTCTVS
jgi:prepilin-type N-terminal cleavage/methylation domain-containing protein